MSPPLAFIECEECHTPERGTPLALNVAAIAALSVDGSGLVAVELLNGTRYVLATPYADMLACLRRRLDVLRADPQEGDAS